ncbi:succinate-semialdehyde dehydrogenase/glutarate-semialdehyde dehydrogenase [Leeuwenhoekiella aestuarii]|uniref:Succinate-semialdehyde dehydrogenase/glutarate-semialdehyde dehydrogenase n=1 Tax=Leeuwenhoekiella aestuarii TaxID=2249426 RepID=A0A4Q0NY73_9FLAO|nr:NAD-dependent succinate-semialdehyde dehydrogenase [Leeuwenhoekiella aestuarii]RXG16205.1 succinate-semialdehyde dehydrogenase/glutarate-semialdehyde dehydrogenase [Leeuwenhoekiella aestuarii]RXG16898.1 succinate-semialdehyde dehydrogenase/glutarate-semialdehyde dehydrogenase [Leeuwenhoekiella aestuarii]
MIKSINPYNQQVVFETKELTKKETEEAIDEAHKRFLSWRKTSYSERSKLMHAAAAELKKNKQEYAETMTLEMGKPIAQSIAEIEKCAWVCEYYAAHAESHLADKTIKTDAAASYVSYEPLGVVLAVMPWNYPFWQVFRFAAPALMAGNIGILKHASNVMQSAINIQKVFERAGFPKACFTNLPLSSSKIEAIIKNPKVKAVTLTGSKPAGSAVASTAGNEIKKSVLELGGSNALVVFEDCNLEETLKTAVQARFQNTGQSCIAGKRLILHKNIAEAFTENYVKAVRELKSGDPMDENTYIGVMARPDLAEELEAQLKDSVNAGAEVLIGGKRNNAYFEPTVVTGVTPEMSLFKEETFGPVIGITTFETEEEAVDLVNQSEFGLGVSIFTEDMERAKKLVPLFDDGAVFVNELVKSDPRLPFGGTKISGYGRELSADGIQEFVNRKTVYFNKY